jgi:hypothetical protein
MDVAGARFLRSQREVPHAARQVWPRLGSDPGRVLYVETGISGTVDEFRVSGDGTLTRIGTVTGLPSGLEGIAAS